VDELSRPIYLSGEEWSGSQVEGRKTKGERKRRSVSILIF